MQNKLKMNQLNVKRLTYTAQLPTKNLPTDAGFDIFSDETITIDNSITAFPNERAHSFRCGMIVRSDTEYH